MTRINLNRIPLKIQKGTKSFVSGMSNGNLLAPIIALETAVTLGRTYQAQKRGGFVESRERFTEETIGAIFWLGGIKFFNKIGDFAGQKLLKIKNLNFDTGKDAMRNPFQQFLRKIVLASKLAAKNNPNAKIIDINKLKKTLTGFKAVKIVSSVLLANTFIGFIVPKINQSITKQYQKSINNSQPNSTQKALVPQSNQPAQSAENSGSTTNVQANSVVVPAEKQVQRETIEAFKNKTQQNSKDTSFKGVGIDKILDLTYKFENVPTYQLLSTDVGVAGGRTISARNNNERLEILIRDVGSIYFYLFCRNHINKGLNKLQDGRGNRLDAVSSDQLHRGLARKMRRENKQSMDVKAFEEFALGDKNAKIPQYVQFSDKGIITLEEFKKVEKDLNKVKLAEKMAKLQPALDNKFILNQSQVLDVYKGGAINDPSLLNQIFKQFTNKASNDSMSFVKQKDLDKLKKNIVDSANDIIKYAEKNGANITQDVLKKTNKINYLKNIVNLGAGFAVSLTFLSTVIPKFQYWVTKKLTGKDSFPGVDETLKNKKLKTVK